jgi:uncharacterized repeat protein (TIGR01451 family)
MRRQLTWRIACMALCISAASAPARAEVTHYPQVSAPALTADFDLVGNVHIQLDVKDGAFLAGDQAWASRYTYNVSFDQAPNVEAVVTSVEPSSCGNPYVLTTTGAWTTSTYEDFSSRTLVWQVADPANGLPGDSAAAFTGYTDAVPSAGNITVRGFVKQNGIWQSWSAEAFGVTMGCTVKDPPPAPSMTIAIASNKNPIGLDETLTTTIVVNNTGPTDLEGVVVTQDGIANTTYVPNSTMLNDTKVDDVDGNSALVDGVTVNIPTGQSATVSCSLTVNDGARGSTLNCVAHAAMDGFKAITATAEVQVTDSIESALAALTATNEAAKDAGAFRGRFVLCFDVTKPIKAGVNPSRMFELFNNGFPLFVRLIAGVQKALDANSPSCAIALLDQLAAAATHADCRQPVKKDANGNPVFDANGFLVLLTDHRLLTLFNNDDASQAFGPQIAAAAKAVKALILANGPVSGSTSNCVEQFVSSPNPQPIN